jgi:hypothetical protein
MVFATPNFFLLSSIKSPSVLTFPGMTSGSLRIFYCTYALLVDPFWLLFCIADNCTCSTILLFTASGFTSSFFTSSATAGTFS